MNDIFVLSKDKKSVLSVKDKKIIDLVIPMGIISIRENAFSECLSLKSIDIPNTVTSIGDNAFSGCSSLQNIDIPNSVTDIGENSFK